jgi:hypothetical protein
MSLQHNFIPNIPILPQNRGLFPTYLLNVYPVFFFVSGKFRKCILKLKFI